MYQILSLLLKILLPLCLLNGSTITGKVYQEDSNYPREGANVLFVNLKGDEFGASKAACHGARPARHERA